MKVTNFIKRIRKRRSLFSKILEKASHMPMKRNVVLLVDNIFEKNANIQDNFTFFEYLYSQKNWELVPYYILHSQSPYRRDLLQKYGRHIILWDRESPKTWQLRLRFLFLMPKLRYVCDGFQAIKALPFDFHNIVKNAPCITSIFTQHGVNFFKPDFVTPDTYGRNIFDKVLVSNDMEKKLFIERANFSPNNIILNGLMRWNNIHDSSAKQSEKSVFIFFTTRRYLSKLSDLQSSRYVTEILNILNCIKGANLGVKVKIALHHSAADLLSPILRQMGIDLVSEDGIFQVKQSSSLLITDYSSMCFEFFLQGKPVIFYSLNDSEDCQKYGQTVDVADPYVGKKNILPNVVTDQDQLIKMLAHYTKNHFQLSAKEKEKQNLFFYYKSDFCERLKKYLINHLQEGL